MELREREEEQIWERPPEAWPSSFQAEGGCEKQQNVMHLIASGLLFDF